MGVKVAVLLSAAAVVIAAIVFFKLKKIFKKKSELWRVDFKDGSVRTSLSSYDEAVEVMREEGREGKISRV